MKRKLNNEELITFCSQMALILKSGISSLEGIYIMEMSLGMEERF